ncbi:phosphoribosyl-ATP diphosphatase [Dubosiella muris]|uniref:Phosphoribosyl-ATP diphosphatase n=2 Tax=Dubosiella muris TaxID=3038133 RepID=A0AC61R6N8_9FIRM|nr:phosphoribosyl-ATP diphosphatase [Dubosiella muris]TGY65490.1 phosphoribosyl-ATP diphosphatase [Dubosiella muris]
MNVYERVFETILDRKANPEQGSYTTYLFEKGLEKILKKVGEESTEVIIASCKHDKEEVINEYGDLIYHLLVLMAELGITLDDIHAVMEERDKKTHNLKAERKPIENL